MGNIVKYGARPDLGCIQMSNGLTAVFVGTLALAASKLAMSDSERQLAAWVASHDQGVFGLGIVGFDVSELPWQCETFTADRGFLLSLISAARARTGWERLDYQPLEAWLQPALDAFRTFVEAFKIEHACRDEGQVWRYGQPLHSALCPIHQIYLHAHGCVLCHDQ